MTASPDPLRTALKNLLSSVDVYIPDSGTYAGKLILAIGYEHGKHWWTPQNPYEHAVIGMLSEAIQHARAVFSQRDDLGETGQAPAKISDSQ